MPWRHFTGQSHDTYPFIECLQSTRLNEAEGILWPNSITAGDESEYYSLSCFFFPSAWVSMLIIIMKSLIAYLSIRKHVHPLLSCRALLLSKTCVLMLSLACPFLHAAVPSARHHATIASCHDVVASTTTVTCMGNASQHMH